MESCSEPLGPRPGPAPVPAPAPPRELSLRALAAGAIIGVLLCAANLVLGLKTGFWDSGAITAALLGFAMAAALRIRGFTALENNITQTTAASMAAMPSVCGLLGALPALALLGHAVPEPTVALWGLLLGGLGVGVAVLLRRRLLEVEALPFPTGEATAGVISAMHARGHEALGRAWALVGSGLAAATVALVRDTTRLIPAWSTATASIGGLTLRSLGLGIGWSPMMFGAGMLVGPRIGGSILAGSLLGWGVLAPLVVGSGRAQADFASISSWLTFPAVALIAGASLGGLGGARRALRTGLLDVSNLGGAGDVASGIGGRAPLLMATAGALTVLVGWRLLGVHPALGAAALALALFLAVAGARAAGQTDIAPIGQIGQLSQAAFGLLAHGQPVVNIAAASIPAGCAAQTTSTLWAMRAGARLGASWRAQVIAQLAGVVLGAAVSAPLYALLSRRWPIGGANLPAPSALQWKAFGQLMAGGAAALPSGALFAAALAFAVGLVMAQLARRPVGRLLPSAEAIGVAMIVPAHYAVSIGLGALAVALARRRRQALTDELAAPIGGGAIAGESLAGVAIALVSALRE